MKKLGIYIHIPFCKQKCSYCDFLSFSSSKRIQQDYIQALLKEIKEKKSKHTVETVFFGGGTPSLLDFQEIALVMDQLKEHFLLLPDCEITIECNPESCRKEKFEAYRAMGINRISLGVQSFSDRLLRAVSRIHDGKEAIQSFLAARSCGFDNINLDFIYSLPHMTLDDLEQTLHTAITLQPEHLSFYDLMIAEKTALYEQNFAPSSDEFFIEQNKLIRSTLHRHSYRQYEFSNYAKEGYECKHNLKYWDLEEYLGLGLGASSYLAGKRTKNTSSLTDYLNANFHPVQTETIEKNESMWEYIILQLRKNTGISTLQFKELYGVDFIRFYKKELADCIKQGLLNVDKNKVFLTEKGQYLSNQVFVAFLPDQNGMNQVN